MNNKIVIGIILVIVVIGGLILISKYPSSNNQQLSVQPQTSSQTNPQISPKTSVASNNIVIQNFSFNPSSLTVKQGTKVAWVNNDSAPHKIKSDAFNSTDLNQGDKFEFTFNNKGTFTYICSIHPSMKGEIIVE